MVTTFLTETSRIRQPLCYGQFVRYQREKLLLTLSLQLGHLLYGHSVLSPLIDIRIKRFDRSLGDFSMKTTAVSKQRPISRLGYFALIP